MNIVSKDLSILKKSEGYWSKGEVYFNPTDSLVILTGDVQVHQMIRIIRLFINEHMREWVYNSVKRALKQKYGIRRLPYSGFNFNSIQSLRKEEWSKNGVFSPILMHETLSIQGYTEDMICDLLTDAWISEYGSFPHRGTNFNLLSEHSLLAIAWEKIVVEEVFEFLDDLHKLSAHSADPGEYDETYRRNGVARPASSRGSSVAGKIIKLNNTKPAMVLIDKYSGHHLKDINESYVFFHLSSISKAATASLLILRANNVCILPTNCISDAALMDKLGISKNVYGMEIVENFGRSFTGAFYHLFATSTISNLNDIPTNLRDCYETSTGGFIKAFTNILKNYGEQKQYPTFPFGKLKQSRRKEHTKYSLGWCTANLPKAWSDFAISFWQNNTSSVKSKSRNLARFISWAWEEQKFSSPWIIRPENLRNPHMPGNNDTFFAFIKKGKKTSSETMYAFWNAGEILYRAVCNDSLLPMSPLYGQTTNNPFDQIPNPIKTRIINKLLDLEFLRHYLKQ